MNTVIGRQPDQRVAAQCELGRLHANTWEAALQKSHRFALLALLVAPTSLAAAAAEPPAFSMGNGERFILTLHNDSNANEIFDFVFVDEANVMDRAGVEGTKMITHVVAAP